MTTTLFGTRGVITLWLCTLPLLVALAQEPAPKAPRETAGIESPDEARKSNDAVQANESKSEKTDSPESSSAAAERQRQLEEIQRRLQQLLEEVKAMRSPPAPQQSTTEVPKPPTVLDSHWFRAIGWRSIGPANMGGRIASLAVHESDPSTFWVATASGGLLKTTNNGITFEHQFDHEATVSIGSVAVAASDMNTVWVGTGENNPRNSVSYGDGVYKSTDGGKTWKNMGLKKSFQIGQIVIHPSQPDTVYVGALGRLYGPNEERGLFKTTDGGQTWQKILYADENTGIIDMVMHPNDPETLVVALWERRRDGFDSWPGNEVPRTDGYDGYDPIVKWGASGGLFKTTDGGKTFHKLAQGLPTGKTGRIGLDWQRREPYALLAIIDGENIGKGPPPSTVYLGLVGQDVEGQARLSQVIPDSPASKAGLQVGDVITKVEDQSLSAFNDLLDVLREKRPGQKIKLVRKRGDDSQELEIKLAPRSGAAGPPIWLGVNGEESGNEVRLTQIVPNAPAAKAGLEVGDMVLAVDEQKVTTFEQLIEQVRARQAGEKIKLQIRRGGETKDVEVTVEDRPGSSSARPTGDAFLGIQGEDAPGGARLTAITDEGPAEKAGLAAGDIVQAIDGKKVGDYEALAGELRSKKAGDKIVLTVQRGEESKQITATMEPRPGGATATRPYAFNYGGQSPNVQDQQGSQGHEYGGVYRSTDAGENWTRINSLNSRPMYFSVVRVDPSDGNYICALGVSQYISADGGATFSSDFGRGVHADGHAMWIDPRDGRHMILGTDGGVYVTYDRGKNWDHLNHAAIGQFYHVAISPQHPYYVTGGLQDNGTWFGPSLTRNGTGPINEDWIGVGGGDGFMCRVDPEEPDLVYFTSQNGTMSRRNLRTGQRASIRPERPRNAPPYRFNWNTPFILSNHNSRIFYCAGNYVFRSLDRGHNLQVMSPEITITKRGSATALAESPLDANVLYVGTDDGALWVTRDGGKEWKDITKNVGLSAPRWVSTIEPSRFAAGRVYACFDGHRSDDDEPYVYVSEDSGATWKSLRGNLPWGSTRCLREDTKNGNLLFAGTEFACWCSLDRGQTWNKLNNNLPTVAVHDVAIHPGNGEMVAATHGRSVWICDVTPLREMPTDKLTERITLYPPPAVIRWQTEPSRGRTNRRFTGTNPPAGVQIYYSLPKKAERVSVKVVDIAGNTLRELRGTTDPGLNKVTWDLARTPGSAGGPRSGPAGPGSGPRPTGPRRDEASPMEGTNQPAANQPPQLGETPEESPAAAAPSRRSASATAAVGPPSLGSRPQGGGRFGARIVAPGNYRLVLVVDGEEFSQTARIDPDPNLPPGQIAEEEEVMAEENEEEEEEGEEQDRRAEDESIRSRIDD